MKCNIDKYIPKIDIKIRKPNDHFEIIDKIKFVLKWVLKYIVKKRYTVTAHKSIDSGGCFG